MKKLQAWQENKVEVVMAHGKVSKATALKMLESVDWDSMSALKEIVKNQKKVVDIAD